MLCTLDKSSFREWPQNTLATEVCSLNTYDSRYVRESNIVMDCGFRVPGTGLQILCQWNLDSEFLGLYSGSQSPGFPIQQVKISRIQDSTFSTSNEFWCQYNFWISGRIQSSWKCWFQVSLRSCTSTSSWWSGQDDLYMAHWLLVQHSQFCLPRAGCFTNYYQAE